MSKKKDIRRQNVIQLILGLVIIALLNLIGQHYFTRFDLTSEKKYTLSETTKELVRSFDDYVTFRVYLEGDFPAGFKKLKRETREMLDEFVAYNANIQYEFIDPSEVTDQRRRNDFYADLNEKGIEPTTLRTEESGRHSQQLIFPGAIVNYKATREEAVNFLESQMGASTENQINASIQALEYNLATVLKKLKSAEKDKIAFLHGHGEIPKLHLEGAKNALSEFYNVSHFITEEKVNSLLDRTEVDSSNVEVEPRFKAIIIARPTKAFSKREKFLIDQYIMHGGKVLWMIDPVMTDMDSLQASPRTLAMPADLNLDDLLFRYGVRLNRNLIQDLRSAEIPLNTQPAGMKPRFEMFPWPYFPVLMPAGDHPIVKNLNGIKGEFTSTLDTISENDISKTMLLKTSPNTRVLRAPTEINLSIINRKPTKRAFNSGSQNVAVLLEGSFPSVYKNRMPPEITKSKKMAFRTKSHPTQMIVASDGDIIKNASSARQGNTQPLPLGVDKFTGQQYGNEDFIVNAMNYLCDETGLLNVRSRNLEIRIMDRAKIAAQKMQWQIINVVIPVALVLLLSLVWNLIRRRKYIKKNKN
ncbi:MAG: gliding motility-associated ABC transporter substrate-binding protein GldG [Bacteroidales bacterium]